jgi:mannose-6-phosphate isomerase-like protein (cupin superfamily)
MKILTVVLFGVAWVIGAYAQDTLVSFPRNSKQGSVAFESIGGPGNYTFQIARRDGRAGAEVHKNWSYVFAVQEGEATINYGGQVENLRERDKKVDDGEYRGNALSGAKSHHAVAGEIILIPAGLPYQIMVDSGTPFCFFVVKMEKK